MKELLITMCAYKNTEDSITTVAWHDVSGRIISDDRRTNVFFELQRFLFWRIFGLVLLSILSGMETLLHRVAILWLIDSDRRTLYRERVICDNRHVITATTFNWFCRCWYSTKQERRGESNWEVTRYNGDLLVCKFSEQEYMIGVENL